LCGLSARGCRPARNRPARNRAAAWSRSPSPAHGRHSPPCGAHLQPYRLAPPRAGLFRCAEHDRQLGGESPPSKPDGGEGLAKRKGVVARRGDQGERGSAKHAPGAEPGSRDPGAGPRRPRGTGWPRTVDRIWSKLPIFGEAEAEGLIGSQPWFSSYSWPRPSWRCTGRGDGRPTGPPARPRRRPYLPGPF
jgi:hypothetical protein